MLLGCDYLDPIRGVGPKKALKLIQEHETLERVLDHLHLTSAKKENPPSDGNGEEVSSKKRAGGIQVPDIWPFQEARILFQSPEVLDGHNIQVRTLVHYLTRQAQVGPAQDRRASIFPVRRKRIWVRAIKPLTASARSACAGVAKNYRTPLARSNRDVWMVSFRTCSTRT